MLLKKCNVKFTVEQLLLFGMSQYKARMYKALCEYGEMKAMDLVRTSGVPQSKIYDIAAELEYDGLVQEIQIDKCKGWRAMSFLKILDNKIRELQDMKRFFE